MKILAYCTREDEKDKLNEYSQRYGHVITNTHKSFCPETAYLAKGYDGIIIFVNCEANKKALEKISSYGVKYIASKAAGVNNIDLKVCKELGIKVANVPEYSPNAISEITMGLIISLLRKINTVIRRSEEQNFTLDGLLGTEIRDLTIAVIGTGRIGTKVIKALHGFECNIIANDIYKNKEAEKYATYKSLDEIYEEADIITLHCPLESKNYHMINDASISKMKEGVMIINVARGGLIDTEAIIRGLKTGKIGGVAIDTYENEKGIFYHNHVYKVLKDDVLIKLLQYPNVIITPHYAFYTKEAVKNMIDTTLLNMKDFELTDSSQNEVI